MRNRPPRKNTGPACISKKWLAKAQEDAYQRCWTYRFRAVKAAIARKVDILIIDTAGRLHNKANLMTELNKIQRVIKREIAEAPHETLLVLDATTGQNAISQAELFTKSAPISGLVLTKLDGTAKGGVVIGLKSELSMPVKWIGVGEGMDDLRPFVANDFAAALFNQKVEE